MDEQTQLRKLINIKQDGNVPSRRHILGSKIFKEQLLEIFGKKYFFPKKIFGKKVAQCRKPKKRSFRLIQRFLQTGNFKKMQGIKFDKIRKFSKKSRIVPKKTQRGDPLVSLVLLEALKNLWFSARIEPTLAGLVEDEQI